MNWYYVEAGQQMGPVDDAGLSALVAGGRINADTLVWREGMANWQAYRQIQPGGAPVAAAPASSSAASSSAGEAVCAECGNLFPISETIQISGARVCANCKPVFVQKMREGVSTSFAGAGMISEEQLLARPYRVELGDALSRGWSLFTANAGIMIGTAILVFLTLMAFTIVGAIMGRIIPFSNTLLTVLYSVPLLTGMFWLAVKLLRGENGSVGDGFAGFKNRYVQLMGMGAIQLALNIVCYVPLIIAGIVFGASLVLARRGQQPQMPALAGGAILGLVIAGVISVCALFVVNTLLTFAPLLIIDKNYGPVAAIQLSWKMVKRRWWMTFGFMFVSGLICILGILFCLFPALATGPLYFNMKAILYDDNFRDLAPRA